MYFAIIAAAIMSFAVAAKADLREGAQGGLVYKESTKNEKAEFFLPEFGKEGSVSSFQVKNIRGFLVLDEFVRSGFENFRTVIAVGQINSKTGVVELFEGIDFESSNQQIRFSTKGESYPQLKPSINNLLPSQASLNRFRFSLASALIQQTMSDRYTSTDAVASRFIDDYSNWRKSLPESERLIFDRTVVLAFANSNYRSLYSEWTPYAASGLMLLSLMRQQGVFEGLSEGERRKAADFLLDILDVEKLDFLKKGRAKDLLVREKPLLAELRARFSGVLSSEEMATAAFGCEGIEAGFNLR